MAHDARSERVGIAATEGDDRAPGDSPAATDRPHHLDAQRCHELVHGLLVMGAAGSRGLVPIGPGWFDSSFDLEAGLEVREGWPSDAAFEAWNGRFSRQPGGR